MVGAHGRAPLRPARAHLTGEGCRGAACGRTPWAGTRPAPTILARRYRRIGEPFCGTREYKVRKFPTESVQTVGCRVSPRSGRHAVAHGVSRGLAPHPHPPSPLSRYAGEGEERASVPQGSEAVKKSLL